MIKLFIHSLKARDIIGTPYPNIFPVQTIMKEYVMENKINNTSSPSPQISTLINIKPVQPILNLNQSLDKLQNLSKTKKKQMEEEEMRPIDEVRFPALNISINPRVIGQRVNNAKVPLLKYREDIVASNRGRSYESDYVDASLLRKFEEKDGLIYGVKNMSKDVKAYIDREVKYFKDGKVSNEPAFKRDMEDLSKTMLKDPTDDELSRISNETGNIKILICVCMYNESKNAINLTLNGIYKNLRNLREKEGISNGDIAVCLMQDGILKLVQDTKQRTLAKGENSMVKFYEEMDRKEGKDKCELLERINTILEETENYDRFNMLGNVKRNRDIPPSIEKNISLLYQNLWKPSKTYFPDPKQNGKDKPEDTDDELKIFSCFKHTNGTKLSSHLWFFEGFCRYFKPEYCVLLDVGTVPDEMGIVNLIKGLSQNQSYGGATGFMSVDSNFPSEEGGDAEEQKTGCFADCFYSIEKAQEYEYIISHFIDKNAESALGFLHVLPGAWSAYRYDALIKSEKFELNLLEKSYFKMILNPDIEEKDFRQANMYLAEDRILSLGIYAQTNCNYTLKYVPNAIAKTDPMKDHENLMNQRRRWINSSFFAFFYVFNNYYFHVVESSHNFIRKYVTLNLSMLLALLSMLNSYITPAVYFFVLYSTIYQLGIKGWNGEEWVVENGSGVLAKVITGIYTIIFLAGVAGAITGRQWSKRAGTLSAVFSIFTFVMFLLVVYNVIFIYLQLSNNPIADQLNTTDTVFNSKKLQDKQILILVLIGINVGSFLLLIISHLFTHPEYVWKLFKNTISYMSYTGAYAQTMVIHGFCNVDDVSWGTKGSASGGGKKYETDKVFFVTSWLFVNAVLAFIFIYVDIISLENGNNKTGGLVLIIISVYGTVVIGVKVIFALVYHYLEMFRKCCYRPITSQLRVKATESYWKRRLEDWKIAYNENSRHNMASIRYKK